MLRKFWFLFTSNKICKLSVFIFAFLFLGCEKEDIGLDNVPFYRDKIFSERNILLCKVPVPESISLQSQTHPSILYFKEKWNGYNCWLATTPYPNGNAQLENPCIYYANYESGVPPVVFNGIEKNPIWNTPNPPIGYNSDVEIFYYKNFLYSLIRECYNGRYIREIKVQKSSDGFNWSPAIHLYSDEDCTEKFLLSPSIIYYNDKLRIYHLNSNVIDGIHGRCTSIEIMEGTSLDNPDFKWLKFGSFVNKDSVKIEPWHMDLFEYENKLFMVFCGRDIRTANSAFQTYLAVSNDYESFRIYSKPLIMDFHTYRPTAYVDENGYFNLYCSKVGFSREDGSDRSIGLARIKMDELLIRLNK